MKMVHLTVCNYRGLRDFSIPLSRFGCVIGRNNAGKSTVLQAIALFFSGTKLSKPDYFDETLPIRIAIKFSDVTSDDLSRLAEEHREKIGKIVVNGSITLVRHYSTDGKGRLRVECLTPKEARFQEDSITTLLKGRRRASDIIAVVEVAFPELVGKLDTTANQTKARELIQQLAETLTADCKEIADADLPTGIDSSVSSFLPECIYIPAVKNLADDTKTSQTTPFGKILGILLEAVEPKLGDIAALFKDLHAKFNRQVGADGIITDNRLDEVKIIENTVQGFVRESFAGIELEIKIPPPELRTLLSSAQILVDDGVTGLIDSKGDGLRRAVVFAVLRSYVELNQPGGISGSSGSQRSDRYVLLFEEPEIYLHPSAQQTLFEALKVFSVRNHLLISTHSPSFFGPSATDNFIRLSKRSDPTISSKPFTVANRVDMDSIKEKDRFQLICYENNNAAFFFDTVVLVEGDSDFVLFPHIARLLSPKWELAQASLRFARIGGKNSIRRYCEFFSTFDVSVVIITDLDILTNGFEQLDSDEELTKLHNQLIQAVDNEISTLVVAEPNTKQVKKAQESGELKSLWQNVRLLRHGVKEGKATFDELTEAVEAFFAWEKRNLRLECLKTSKADTVLAAKKAVIAKLRNRNIFVLERGTLESYYPPEVIGVDKPTKAQDYCRKVITKDDVYANCDDIEHDGCVRKELDVLCESLVAMAISKI